jgi:hypothetical protein
MHNIEGVFSLIQLSIAVPARADKSTEDSLNALLALPQRSDAFYDESLQFLLTAQVSHEHALSRSQATQLFSSPALEIVAELGYAEAATNTPRPPSKASPSGVPFTPLPEPDSNQEDATFTAAQVSTIWHTTFNAEKGLMSVNSTTQGWMAIWAFDAIVCQSSSLSTGRGRSDEITAYPAVNLTAPLLALTCTLTLKLGLDPSLKDLFNLEDRPPSPPAKATPQSKKKRLSGPVYPSTGRGPSPGAYPRSATPPSGLYRSSHPRSSSPAPARPIEKFDPEKETKRVKAAAARRKRSQQEEYAFAGFDDVNLLDSLGHALDLNQEDHFPSSRLHPAVTSSAIGVSTYSRGMDPQVGHTRRHSRAQSVGNIAEAWPTLRRSHRKTLKVHSAIHLRIRALEAPINLPSQNGQEPDPEIFDSTGTTMSVEVENNRQTGMGFEVDSIWVEVYSAVANSTLKRLPSLLEGQNSTAIRLQRIDQLDFLFSLKAADVLDDDPLASDFELPPTPISAVLRPGQMLTGAFQQRAGAYMSFQADEEHRITPSARAPKGMHRTVCVIVKGRPISLGAVEASTPNGLSVPSATAEPQAVRLPTYFTASFESRWNCALDLTSLVARRDERRSSVVSTGQSSRPQSALPQRSNSMPVNSSMPSPVAGNKRYSMSSLNNFSLKRDSMQEIPLDRPSSAPVTAIPDVHSIKRTSHPTLSGNRLEALKEVEADIEPALPTPAFPPYSSTRPEADFVGPLSHSPTDNDFGPLVQQENGPPVYLPGAAQAGHGGLLLHVSLIQPAPVELPAVKSAMSSPNLSKRSQVMMPTFSSTSAVSAMSAMTDQPQANRISVLEPFQLEIFVMNKTDRTRRLQIGIPSRKALQVDQQRSKTVDDAGKPDDIFSPL